MVTCPNYSIYHLESWKSLGSEWSSSGRETKSVKYSSFPATTTTIILISMFNGTSEVGPKAPLLLALEHQLGLGIHSHSKSLRIQSSKGHLLSCSGQLKVVVKFGHLCHLPLVPSGALAKPNGHLKAIFAMFGNIVIIKYPVINVCQV